MSSRVQILSSLLAEASFSDDEIENMIEEGNFSVFTQGVSTYCFVFGRIFHELKSCMFLINDLFIRFSSRLKKLDKC